MIEGRPDLREVAFPNLGLTLKVRRIPAMLVQDWRSGLPKPPAPPTQEVDYGGQKRTESNPMHPDYQAALVDHDYRIGMMAIEFAIERGVEIDVDQQAVSELREWAAGAGIELPKSDKVLYVSRILLPDLEDLLFLRRSVFERVEASEETIAQAVERFPSSLPGA